MADLGLANAVNSAKPLLDAIGIPGEIIVHHQVSTLKIDTFASGVGCKKHLHVWVMPEGFLRLHPFLAAHAAVDRDDRLRTSQQS